MLVGSIVVKGGKGGRAGANGAGGNAGKGGQGGKSLTWTESVTVKTQDSNGGELSHQEFKKFTNTGGVSGPDGEKGQAGTAEVTSG